jgi:hypothetical protein
MALLGTLQVRLGLDAGVFSKGLSKFSKDVKGQTAGISKGFSDLIPTKALLAGLGSLATAATAVSFAKMIQGANNLTDTLRDSSIRLGIGVGDLQAFQLAAGNAGIESNKLTDLLGKLNKASGEIKLGIGNEKTVDAFRSIGLSVADIQRSNPAQLFESVIGGLGGIQDPAARAATAMAIFGRSGQAALTLVADGTGSLRQSRQLLDGLGLSLTKINADNVDAANDALGTLGFLATAAKQKLGAELAPVITDLANRFLQAGQSGQNLGQQITQAANALGQIVNAALAVGNTLSAVFNLITAGFAGIGSAVLGFASTFVTAIGTTAPNAFNSLLEATENGLTRMKQGFADFATAAANVVVAGMNKAIEAVDALVNGAAAGISTFLELANKVPGVNLGSFSYSQTSEKASSFSRFPVDRVDLGRVGTFGGGIANGLGSYSEGFGIEAKNQLADAGTDIRQAFQAGEAVFNPAQSADLAAGLQEATTYANELTGALGGSGGGAAGGGAKGAVEDLGKQFEETGEAIKFHGLEIQNVWNNSMQSIGSAIDDLVKTGKLDFKSLVDSIIADLASVALKNAISSAFSALFGTTSDGSTGQGNAQSYLKLFGSLFQGVGSFEGGGYTGSGPRSGGMDGRGGRLAMVHPNETVIDHEKVRGAARSRRRGDAVNLTVPITLMPGVSKQELAEILPLVKRDIIQTIPNLISRGGRYAAAYGQ